MATGTCFFRRSSPERRSLPERRSIFAGFVFALVAAADLLDLLRVVVAFALVLRVLADLRVVATVRSPTSLASLDGPSLARYYLLQKYIGREGWVNLAGRRDFAAQRIQPNRAELAIMRAVPHPPPGWSEHKLQAHLLVLQRRIDAGIKLGTQASNWGIWGTA